MTEIVELPAWIAAALSAEREAPARAAVAELDLPVNVERARERLHFLVSAGDVAIEGAGGDDRTYRLCAEMLNMGLSPETAAAEISSLWNPHCVPPWDEDEIEAKVGNAARYMQNEPGSYAASGITEGVVAGLVRYAAEHAPAAPEQPAAASWVEYIDRLVAEQGIAGGAPVRQCEGWLSWRQLRARPREQVEWAWYQRLLANETNIYTGMPGIGKTTLSLNLAAAIAAGLAFLGYDTKAMPVALLLAEDVYGPVEYNLAGIAEYLGVGDDVLDDMLKVWSVKSDPHPGGHMLARIADDGTITPTRFLLEKVIPELMRHRGPVLFIVDPLAEFVSANRNLDVPARAIATGFFQQLCRLNGGKVTVLANDHPSKSSQNDQSYIAGSVQVSAAFALTATLRKPDKPAGIEGHKDLTFQTLKPKYGPETTTPLYRSDDCPAFIAGTGPAAMLRDIKNDVYRHVVERAEHGLLTGNDDRSDYGPTEIGFALGHSPDMIRKTLKTLRGAGWILWQPRVNGKASGTYIAGGQAPKISSLEPKPSEAEPW
ncbi:MAG TPA: AAA family ATPase [Stellaceae bacterium]|jgi:hypothetical protein|nr:AAA family ATPase [Stellaceae bacterium]